MSSGLFTLQPYLSIGLTEVDLRPSLGCVVYTLWVFRGSNLCLLRGPVPILEPWLAWENIRDGVGLLALSLWERI